MRILFCWMGVTGYMADCWRELAARQGVELRVIIEKAESGREFKVAETLAGLDYIVVPKTGDGAVEWLDGWMPDVIFTGGWRCATTRRLVAAFRSLPKVFYFDMPWRWKVRCLAARFVLRSFLRKFQAVYVPGKATAHYARWLGFGADEITAGLLAVDQRRYREAAARVSERKGFLFVGRYAPEKRRDLVEEAYARYRAHGGTWTIDYYGQGGKFAQAAEMPRIFAEHACLVLASSFDPWPLVMLEARSAGLQVVASDRCGNVDELRAIKVRYGDVEAMARAMLDVEHGRRVGLPANFADYDCPAWADRTLALGKKVVATARLRCE